MLQELLSVIITKDIPHASRYMFILGQYSQDVQEEVCDDQCSYTLDLNSELLTSLFIQVGVVHIGDVSHTTTSH